ncbi:hypothetical protein [Stenotrophomonas sp. ESTM1D_MKCIP4_1]|uniref:hypothetical protein n=1 Tax=Stenotrophomonas sp. ESTM1D_MKCIP4_1 TaxID=2072414 RepID=UPI00131EF269|nr:hypothetical protein [Stenotrophomonas sp. ESTM1D_MKCIP4_1]
MTTIDGRQVIPASDLPQRYAGVDDGLVGVVRAGDVLATFRLSELPTPKQAQAQIDALTAGQQSNAIYADTLPQLQAIAGTYVGQGAFVNNGSGAGQYIWNGSSWVFSRADLLSQKADRSELLLKASNSLVATKIDAVMVPFEQFSFYAASDDLVPIGAIDPVTGVPLAAFRVSTGELLAWFAPDNPSINSIALTNLAKAVPETARLFTVDGDVVPLLATRDPTDGKVYPLVYYSISEDRLYPGGGGQGAVPEDDNVAYIENGTLRSVGGLGDRIVDADASRIWLQVQTEGGTGKGVFRDLQGAAHAVRIGLGSANRYPVDVVRGISGAGQSNAAGQAGSSNRSIVYGELYEFPSKLLMPATAANNVWMGTPTQGGLSTELLPSSITGLTRLRSTIASTNQHGTVAEEAAGRSYVRRAAAELNGWAPSVVVWTNGEGGQSIQNMMPGAPAGYFYFANVIATVTRITQILAVQGKRFAHAWLNMAQMESNSSDALIGDKHYSLLQAHQAAIYPITGQTVPLRMMTSQMSSFIGGSQSPRSVLDKALAIEQKWGDFWCLGPTYCYPFHSDFLHNTSIGHAMRGEFFDRAVEVMERTGYWRPLHMVSATRLSATQIQIQLSEPAVRDASWAVPDIANAGISVDVGTVESVTVSGSQVTITVPDAAAVSQVGAAVVGHTSGVPREAATIPRSTIRSVASIGQWSPECGGLRMHKALCHQLISIGG